jgi:hypothetical protein
LGDQSDPICTIPLEAPLAAAVEEIDLAILVIAQNAVAGAAICGQRLGSPIDPVCASRLEVSHSTATQKNDFAISVLV